MKTDTVLPEMNVEKRISKTAHGITPPDLGPKNRAKQMQQAIQLNMDAIGQLSAPHAFEHTPWLDTTIEILQEYIPGNPTKREIINSVANVLDLHSWGDVSYFVQEDACSEFFNLALKYCQKQGQVHEQEKGFIDGSGIGYLTTYRNRLKKTLEQCFDAKYFFKVKRPLEYIRDEFGMDLSKVANFIHPGHWSYPAGHGTKFLTAVEVLDDVFHLDKDCYRNLFIAACVASMGRSGNLIHDPQDNLAGGKLTTLKEFK